jgi:hypothetical protein
VSIIDGAPNVVPQRRDELPLVNESWYRPVEQQRRADRCQFAQVILDIEAHAAARVVQSGRRLPARTRTLKKDGTGDR